MDEKKTENGKKEGKYKMALLLTMLFKKYVSYAWNALYILRRMIKRQYLDTYGSGYQSSWRIHPTKNENTHN